MTVKQFVFWFVGASYSAPTPHEHFASGIRDMVYSNLPVDDIACAINGYFESIEQHPNGKWEREVREHLKEFFLKTVNVEKKEAPVTDSFIEKLRKAQEAHEKEDLERRTKVTFDPWKNPAWPQSPDYWLQNNLGKYIVVC